MFPNSGKKLVVVSVAYTPSDYQEGSLSSLMQVKFTVDIEKGEVQP